MAQHRKSARAGGSLRTSAQSSFDFFSGLDYGTFEGRMAALKAVFNVIGAYQAGTSDELPDTAGMPRSLADLVDKISESSRKMREGAVTRVRAEDLAGLQARSLIERIRQNARGAA